MKICGFLFVLLFGFMKVQSQSKLYTELYRPQIHFSPAEHWMNDPNGMVYANGIYHLFYQYYPGASVWGPMHWGHATSTDLIHWKHQPVALFPDSLGYIFSGSAVIDKNNTSGFGKKGIAPLVAIYTNHDTAGEHANRNDFQKQSIAYSVDGGKTWTKYKGNPVLPDNTGIRDFRDPKVIWYPKEKKWIMILAVKDHVAFYSSPNLKDWTYENDFGEKLGAHGGVWECPDLLRFQQNGKEVWVVTVSINPGGPNGGSATQYFTGQFNGKAFTTDDSTETKWMDYGTDNYAGVTWSNTGNHHISLGWMSNWNYATIVPTEAWRSANTLPRELALQKVNGKQYLASLPVKELNKIATSFTKITDVKANGYTVANTKSITTPYRITVSADKLANLSFAFSNAAGDRLSAGYDKESHRYFIDRSKAGKSDFYKGFAAKHWAPRLSQSSRMNITIIIDAASIEMFADDGLTVMTDIFFPKHLLNGITITSKENLTIKTLKVDQLSSIWKQ